MSFPNYRQLDTMESYATPVCPTCLRIASWAGLVVAKTAGGITNWQRGVLVISFVLLAAFSISWFVHYPTVVNTEFGLTSENIPKSIIAKIDGRLEKLSVRLSLMRF